MPEYIRALIFILGISFLTYRVTNKSFSSFMPIKQLKHWQTLWMTTLIAAVATQNFFFFSIIILGITSLLLPAQSPKRVFYYLLLLCVLPLIPVEIPGIAGIRYLFALDYSRLMIVALLIPLFFTGKNKPRLFSFPTDKYLFAFLVIATLLSFRDNTATNSIRTGLLFFIDIFIPYFILSRHIKNHDDLKAALTVLFLGLSPFILIGIFEATKHWFLYPSIQALIFDTTGNSYFYASNSERGFRVSALFASPIVLGYTMILSAGLLLYLKPLVKNTHLINITLVAIVICLLATKSRGPWVGFSIMCMAYLWTGREGAIKLIILTSLAVLSIPILNMTTLGSKYINMLPIIGTTRADTIDYRSRLIENAWSVFQRNPIFGSTNYLETPEMESMRQGQGIIDLVNTFIQIALPYGAVGLFLFSAIFIGLLKQCYWTIHNLPKDEVDLIRMGRALFAILSGILVTIATVSSIDYIPVIYWVLTGIIAAYIQICKQKIIQ